jgi:hypothetical protein
LELLRPARLRLERREKGEGDAETRHRFHETAEPLLGGVQHTEQMNGVVEALLAHKAPRGPGHRIWADGETIEGTLRRLRRADVQPPARKARAARSTAAGSSRKTSAGA